MKRLSRVLGLIALEEAIAKVERQREERRAAGHQPGGQAVIVSQPSPGRPQAPLVVRVPCACGDPACWFTSQAVRADELAWAPTWGQPAAG